MFKVWLIVLGALTFSCGSAMKLRGGSEHVLKGGTTNKVEVTQSGESKNVIEYRIDLTPCNSFIGEAKTECIEDLIRILKEISGAKDALEDVDIPTNVSGGQ